MEVLLCHVSTHQDDDHWGRSVEKHLRASGIEAWTEHRIRAGDDTQQEWSKAIAAARVAVILLSADLCVSENHRAHVNTLLQRQKQSAIRVIALLCRACVWEELLGEDCTLWDGEQVLAAHDGAAAEEVLASLARHIKNLLTTGHGLSATPASVTGTGPHEGRSRLLQGISTLPQDWARRIAAFIEAYTGADNSNPFCGRDADLVQVREWLTRDNVPRNLVLTAEAGRGKSALLVKLAIELALRSDLAVAFVPVSLRFDTHRADVFIGCLAARLAALHGRPVPDLRHATVDILQRMVSDDLDRPLPDGRTLVVILDGLDEATQWKVSRSLFSPRRCTGSRLLISARRRPDDEQGTAWRHTLGWDRPSDAVTVTLSLLDWPDIAAALRRLAPPLDALAKRHDLVMEFLRLCQGEPLTLWLLLTELQDRGTSSLELTVRALHEWRAGLSGWFARWWDIQSVHWRETGQQLDKAARALLALLAIANAPLDRDNIIELVGNEIDGGLAFDELLRSLARIVHGGKRTNGYVLAHPGFAEHLRAQLTDHERASWQSRLVDWTRRVSTDLDNGSLSPAQTPKYVLQCHAGHLEQIDATIEDWIILNSRRWYDAWQAHEPGPAGFLDGVARSWRAIERISPRRVPDTISSPPISFVVECALTQGSIGSLLANIQPELLHLLLEEKIWTPAQALVHARQAPIGAPAGHNRRSELLEVLLPHLPRTSLVEFLDAACDLLLLNYNDGHELLRHTVEYLASEILDTTVHALRRLGKPLRSSLLLKLAEHVPADMQDSLIADALSDARVEVRPGVRASNLVSIAKVMPEAKRAEIVREALEITGHSGIDRLSRFFLLRDLADLVQGADRFAVASLAFDTARALDPTSRWHCFNEILPRLSDGDRAQLLKEVRAVIADGANGPSEIISRRLKVLENVPDRLRPEWLAETFSLLDSIEDESTRYQAIWVMFYQPAQRRAPIPRKRGRSRQIERIASALLSSEMHFALPETDVVKHIKTSAAKFSSLRYRAMLLGFLWETLSAEERSLASRLAGDFSEELVRTHVHRKAAMEFEHVAWMSDRWLDILRCATEAWFRAQVLAHFFAAIPEEGRLLLIDEILNDAAQIRAPDKRVEVLMRVLHAVPKARAQDVFTSLCNAIESVSDHIERSRHWMSLAQKMPPSSARLTVIHAAAEAACKYPTQAARFDVLQNLLRLVTGSHREFLLERMIDAARSEPDSTLRARHLLQLAETSEGASRADFLREALVASHRIGDEEARASVLAAYTPHLPAAAMRGVIGWIDSLPQPLLQVHLFSIILRRTPILMEEVLSQALRAARRVESGPRYASRVATFSELIRFAPTTHQRETLAQEALQLARAELEAARPLPSAAQEDALGGTNRSLTSKAADRGAASALKMVANSLPAEAFPLAFEVADLIADPSVRAGALAAIAAQLDPNERSELGRRILAIPVPNDFPEAHEVRRSIVQFAVPLLPEEERAHLVGNNSIKTEDPRPISQDLSDAEICERIDELLQDTKPKRNVYSEVRDVLSRLAEPRRGVVLDHLLRHYETLPAFLRSGLIEFVSPAWTDRCLDAAASTNACPYEAFVAAAPRLATPQLERALTIVEKSNSQHPNSQMLATLAALSVERLRRERSFRDAAFALFNRMLHAEASTRSGVLAVLEHMAPLTVELGGPTVATEIVSAILRVGDAWS